MPYFMGHNLYNYKNEHNSSLNTMTSYMRVM